MRAASFAAPAPYPPWHVIPGRGRIARRRRVETFAKGERNGTSDQSKNQTQSKETQHSDRLVNRGVLLSRRLGLVSLTSGLLPSGFGVAPPSAGAKLNLEYDGVPSVAYAFDATLEVVALRNSIPPQWETEFGKVTRKGKVSISTAATPKDVYSDLKKASSSLGVLNGLNGVGFNAVMTQQQPGLPGPNGFVPPTEAQLAAANRSKKKANSTTKKDGKTKIAKADVVSLGDEFLAPAVANGLVLPLDESVLCSDWYQRLPKVWRRLGSRNFVDGTMVDPPAPTRRYDANTKRGFKPTVVSPNAPGATSVYGVPYRWGCTLFAYRVDKIPKALLLEIERDNGGFDWPDLWRPEFEKKLAFGSGTRTQLSAALRSENFSANEKNGPLSSQKVTDKLHQLREKQLLVQDDLQYAQALSNGDAWIAVGPSDDILALARKTSLLKVVVPKSGTILFSDVWVVPATVFQKNGGPSPLIGNWFEYTTMPGRVNLRSGLRGGVATTAFDGETIRYDLNRMTGPSGGFVGDQAENASDDSAETALSNFIRNAIAGGDATPGDLTRGGMPRDDVFQNSEFLEPLTPRATQAYNDIIRQWTAETRK